MGIDHPTDEQQAIIHHPLGKHARVLAVAGSGKTTTMVARIKYLVEEKGIDSQMIDVYMFNKGAADHFRDKLSEEIPGRSWEGNVHTFHAVALGIIHKGIKHKTIKPYRQKWLGDAGTSIEKRLLRSIIKSIVNDGDAREGELTPEEALRMIGLWKSSMIAPTDAVCEATPQYVQVYEEFEHQRRKVPALTFDDFVPVAVNILNHDPELLAGEVSRRAFMIIDEYQDINEGQQRLMKLLAGDRSDVMVVGDDDQTIYEWRGAQPEYILSGFDRDFADKPVMVYPLSHSFRFGPLLAQSAYNVVTENSKRYQKQLVAHNSEAVTEISIIDADASTDSGLAQQMSSLLNSEGVSARDIMTLGRTYAQMEHLEAECLKAHIPFLVAGKEPFFARAENLVLVDYMRLALLLDDRVADIVPSYARLGRAHHPGGDDLAESVMMVLSTINSPNRYISHAAVEKGMLRGANLGWTVRLTLDGLAGRESSTDDVRSRERVALYLNLLVRIRNRIESQPLLSAGQLMTWIIDITEYMQGSATSSSGDDENPDDRDGSVQNFVDYATQTELTPSDFIAHLALLDTTAGKPDDQCIVFRSIHRAKGLEADYVFLPGCNDGTMPHNLPKAHSQGIHSTQDKRDLSVPVIHLESERRLFYVAVTRAKKQLTIGTGGEANPSRSPFVDEMQLETTRSIVGAFCDVLRSKTRDVNTAVCRSFVEVCAGLVVNPANAKVAQYARDHYISQLEIPWIKKRVDDAIASIRGTTASVPASLPATIATGRPVSGPWRATIRSSRERTEVGTRPVPETPVHAVSTTHTELYHVTRISNLPSILVAGLLCWDAVNDRASCLPVGENVVQRRIETIPLTGKPVSAYVPLSLCARSPFLHAVTRGSGISDEEIAIVCFDMSRVLSLPGTIYRSTDVQRQAMEFYQAKEFPQHINRCATDAMSYSSGVSGEAEAADVLVQRRIPPELIVGVIVNSDRTLERIQDTLCDLASANPDNDKSYARCMGMLRASPSDFFFSGGTAR